MSYLLYTDCGVLTVSNGIKSSSSTLYESVVKISCNAGFLITGSYVVVCQEDGTWSGKPQCQRRGMLKVFYVFSKTTRLFSNTFIVKKTAMSSERVFKRMES